MSRNIRRVTEQQHTWLGSAPDGSRRALTIVPTRDGNPYLLARGVEPWRAYLFIEGAATYDVIQSPEQAVEAAAAFGEFQNQLAELPAPGLHETIPGFHDTPQRLQKLLDVFERDSVNRAIQVKPEIEAIMNRAALCSYLEDKKATGELPVRTTHNDTKLNNVMLDTKTGKAVCVIDLDTVMPGLSAYDFGDLVRTSTSPAAEDERDLGKVDFRLEMFDALVQGFLSTAGTFLTPTERQALLVAGQIITLETGIRFLTDFLQGDVYFRIHRPQHNLDRCRTQLKLVERMEQAKEQAGNILTKWERHYRLR